MNLVLCMAGIYKRFRDVGYTIPKFLLPWQNRTILQTILQEMLIDQAFSHVLLVANQRDQPYEATLREILASLRGPQVDLLFIADTQGQAETASVACEYLQQHNIGEQRVIFHNIDTILQGRDYQCFATLLSQYDGLIDVFESDKPCYSYVQIDADRLVTHMAEKIVISSLATSGLYGFRSYLAYLQAAKSTPYKNERYISNVYSHMLTHEAQIIVPKSLPHQKTIVLGTPAEYEAAIQSHTRLKV